VAEEDNTSATKEEEQTNFLIAQICAMPFGDKKWNTGCNESSVLYMNV
jgi:hypothetical protein